MQISGVTGRKIRIPSTKAGEPDQEIEIAPSASEIQSALHALQENQNPQKQTVPPAIQELWSGLNSIANNGNPQQGTLNLMM
jgi:hypothetical protein